MFPRKSSTKTIQSKILRKNMKKPKNTCNKVARMKKLKTICIKIARILRTMTYSFLFPWPRDLFGVSMLAVELSAAGLFKLWTVEVAGEDCLETTKEDTGD